LYEIAGIFNPKSIIPATVEFVDISGLVQGSSKGEVHSDIERGFIKG
jgi:hypothetical protein